MQQHQGTKCTFERCVFQHDDCHPLTTFILRGPVAILFISRDTSSDCIAKMFSCLFAWGIAQISRDMLQNGVSH